LIGAKNRFPEVNLNRDLRASFVRQLRWESQATFSRNLEKVPQVPREEMAAASSQHRRAIPQWR
jgi:hypothetical protein